MPPQQTFPEVICPGCDLPMTPEVTESGPHGFHKTTFRCEKCGTETARIYKGESRPPAVGGEQ